MQHPATDSKALYLRLVRQVRPYWRQFALSVVGLVVTAITEPAIPALFKPLLDGEFFEGGGLGMWLAPLALVGLFLVRGLGTYLASAGMAWVGGKIVLDLRRLMFQRLLALPSSFYDTHSTGTTISKVTYDVTQVTGAATRVLTVLVRDPLAIIGLLGWMFYLNWRLTLIALAITPAIIYIVRVVNRRLRHLARSMQRSYGELTGVLEEAVNGHRVIKVYAGEQYEAARFDQIANWIRRLGFKTVASGAASAPLSQLVTVIGLAIIVYVASWQVVNGETTTGGFVSFLAAMGLLFSPIKRLTSIADRLQRGLAAAESIYGFLDEPPEPDRGRGLVRRATGRIQFEDISFQYPSAEHPALRGISFGIDPGETIALVGTSGGGKTTIANLIPRFYDPDTGHILLDGVDTRQLRLQDLRAQIALVNQQVVLFNDTVYANIAYGGQSAACREAVMEAARAAHALAFIEAMPQGFDTLVGDNGVRLSGGQRQRIAIARALLKDAPILILDEATSALDTESEKQVQAALEHLRQGRTTLLVAHRLSTIERADRILVVEQGRIVETGTHQQLLALGGVYTRLYQLGFGKSS